MIAQLRLSWWRDALISDADKRPKGEPLLAALKEIVPDEAVIDAGLKLVNAYEVLATGSEPQEQDAARVQRISAICSAYANWIGDVGVTQQHITCITDWWANPDRRPPKSLPRLLRPLSILALAEQLAGSQQRISPLRVNWHALTGR